MDDVIKLKVSFLSFCLQNELLCVECASKPCSITYILIHFLFSVWGTS